MNFPWAICIAREDAGSLAAIRLISGIQVSEVDGTIWLRGQRGDEKLGVKLSALPATVRYEWLPSGQLRRIEERIPNHRFPTVQCHAERITLLRGVWQGQFQSLSWDCLTDMVKEGFVFEPTAEQGKAVALARLSGSALEQKRFPAADLFFNLECVAGTPSWLPTQGFPFAMGENVVWSVHLASGRAILSCHDQALGRLQRTLDITDDLLGDAIRTEETRLCLTTIENTVAIALERFHKIHSAVFLIG